eukprot:765993-Hanusia_phi.AAC.1
MVSSPAGLLQYDLVRVVHVMTIEVICCADGCRSWYTLAEAFTLLGRAYDAACCMSGYAKSKV